ncbi:MAG: mannose-1-phosphate guanylyltransferase/mannose-6-phosphate isomerase [Alkalimonas sp.]|nr:mannose-1-phosphate guanylyltransferase/mannose-6-phosphate isomerase [Alkalimonas sp.]
MIVPVILAGGTGSRLWPLSRELFPKQFLKLHGSDSMMQATLARLSGLNCARPLVVCNEEHRFIVAEQLRQRQWLDHNILLEPEGRNTAPAIALAALLMQLQGKDPLLLVLAADHVIEQQAAFQRSVTQAIPYAAAGKLVVFGVSPQSPATGFGYIQRGDPVTVAEGAAEEPLPAYQVDRFVEKPDLHTAERFLQSGDYYWNSGMFLVKASKYLAELKQYRPDIYHACQQAIEQPQPDMDFIRINTNAFAGYPAESIDYAVMEHTRDALVLPLCSDWCDVGSWSALWSLANKDEDGNACYGDIISQHSNNNFVYSEDALVALIGVQDLVVVQTKDAVLVATKDQVQQVKSLVEQLKADGRAEHRIHQQVFRPWGHYESLVQGARYQVKHITVDAGERLSSQLHHHRAEHWVIVSGTAKVTINGVVQLLSENESVYIPLGATHSLENPGKIALQLIEVQSGSYLGEDDIVRFEDRYGRG